MHERHLNTDILLALMRALLLQRPDFRLILMSATINVQAYSDYFGGAPIIQASNSELSASLRSSINCMAFIEAEDLRWSCCLPRLQGKHRRSQ